MDNTVSPIISASDITGVTSTLTSQLATVAPALLGLAAVPLAFYLIMKLFKRSGK